MIISKLWHAVSKTCQRLWPGLPPRVRCEFSKPIKTKLMSNACKKGVVVRENWLADRQNIRDTGRDIVLNLAITSYTICQIWDFTVKGFKASWSGIRIFRLFFLSFFLWPMWDFNSDMLWTCSIWLLFCSFNKKLQQLAYTFHGILIRNTTCSFNRSEEANDLLNLEFHLNWINAKCSFDFKQIAIPIK